MRSALLVGTLLVGIGLSSAACALPSAEVRTRASVEIRERAAVSVALDAPFRILISSGSMSTFLISMTPGDTRVAYASGISEPASDFLLDGNSALRGLTRDNEMLSVSVEMAAPSDGLPGVVQHRLPLVLAQFN